MLLVVPYVAAALFVVQSLCLKQFKKVGEHQGEPLLLHASYMLMIAVGFMTWTMLTAWPFTVSLSTFWIAIVYGADFALTMTVYSLAIRTGPLSTTSFCFSASMLLPIAASALFWQESFGFMKWLGVGMFMVSFYFILVYGKKQKTKRITRQWYGYAGLSFLLNGNLSVLSKLQQTMTERDETSVFMTIAFLAGCLFCVIGSVISSRIGRKNKLETNEPGAKTVLQNLATFVKYWPSIVGLALTTGIGNWIVVWLSGKLPGSYLFPTVNGGIIIGLVVVSRFLYKEYLSSRGWVGIIVGIAAMIAVSV
ncbi:hypothetical protein HZF08_01555 [Paenibacillus sp. CGMCC 1.16610]|uniref:EamA domain-containing protein n=1 Tax=Paenibacillus anseongense TaxID=2682845 RepID=A0ABW9U1C4_9BACL|nr:MULTISPECIES: hypothetical protein [Paenibacillus]MBA2936986.1 hypothetical protein [Paenibacillus sp. CGMCC 1.16610]MVQ33311.1 hypothetical protein [Paenibacillus anseongense]